MEIEELGQEHPLHGGYGELDVVFETSVTKGPKPKKSKKQNKDDDEV